MSIDLKASVRAEVRAGVADAISEFMREYLDRERIDPRPWVASATASGVDPTILDFGAVPVGLVAAAGAVTFFLAGNPGPAQTASATAALCQGRPTRSGTAVNAGDVRLSGIAANTAVSVNHKVWVCRGGDHFFLAVYGNTPPLAASTLINATLGVILVPDDLSSLTWI